MRKRLPLGRAFSDWLKRDWFSICIWVVATTGVSISDLFWECVSRPTGGKADMLVAGHVFTIYKVLLLLAFFGWFFAIRWYMDYKRATSGISTEELLRRKQLFNQVYGPTAKAINKMIRALMLYPQGYTEMRRPWLKLEDAYKLYLPDIVNSLHTDDAESIGHLEKGNNTILLLIRRRDNDVDGEKTCIELRDEALADLRQGLLSLYNRHLFDGTP